MTQNDNLSFYADWLLDLAGEKIEGEDLRNVLATRIKSAEDIERAAREVEISRLGQVFLIKIKKSEIAVPAGF